MRKDKETWREARDRDRLRMEHDRLTAGGTASGLRSILRLQPPNTAQSAVSTVTENSEKPPTTANIKGKHCH